MGRQGGDDTRIDTDDSVDDDDTPVFEEKSTSESTSSQKKSPKKAKKTKIHPLEIEEEIAATYFDRSFILVASFNLMFRISSPAPSPLPVSLATFVK
jgi:hypothetical protein